MSVVHYYKAHFSHRATNERMTKFIQSGDTTLEKLVNRGFIRPPGDPAAGSLVIDLGMDQIQWGYKLNTHTIPTYGGEVVQILSAYIEDMTIAGTCGTYREMESIYRWFLTYFQSVTQTGGFNGDPVHFTYPHRGWSFDLQPTQLPGFRYSTDTVAPQWQLQAFVHEGPDLLPKLTEAELEKFAGEGFGVINGDIGYDPDNPFSTPGENPLKGDQGDRIVEEARDFYNDRVREYIDGEYYNGLTGEFGSGPAFLNPSRRVQLDRLFDDANKERARNPTAPEA